MAIKTIGSSGVEVEVETLSKSLRAVQRPTDVGALGSFAFSLVSGVIAAGIAANAPIVSLRNAAANPILIRKFELCAYINGTAFTAGMGNLQAFIARSFSASDSGQTAVTLTGGKMRTSQTGPGIADLRVANTGAITPGTRTLDSTPFAQVAFPVPGTVTYSALIPAKTPLFKRGAGEWPLVLGANEGVVIQANMPATGTWTFSLDTEWDEVSTYGTGLAS